MVRRQSAIGTRRANRRPGGWLKQDQRFNSSFPAWRSLSARWPLLPMGSWRMELLISI